MVIVLQEAFEIVLMFENKVQIKDNHELLNNAKIIYNEFHQYALGMEL